MYAFHHMIKTVSIKYIHNIEKKFLYDGTVGQKIAGECGWDSQWEEEEACS